MISVDNDEIFKQYYQVSYDFNTSSLSEKQIYDIKTLVKEKRVSYALAPIGEKIFNFIIEQSTNIHFELVELNSDKIDGMLYIPKSGDDKAYIILNGKKPFINQIFAAAHEYYHYINDYVTMKEKPYFCCLKTLNSINEKKASRFAAELLLPEEALKKEIGFYKARNKSYDKKDFDFKEYAIISMILTIKYQLPLKAVIYRLHEEGYIDNINRFIKNYNVIKSVLMQIEIFKDNINNLYSNENSAINNIYVIYQQMEMAYKSGLASREEIIRDADNLNLNKDIINSFFDIIDETDDDGDDTEILNLIKSKWGGDI